MPRFGFASDLFPSSAPIVGPSIGSCFSILSLSSVISFEGVIPTRRRIDVTRSDRKWNRRPSTTPPPVTPPLLLLEVAVVEEEEFEFAFAAGVVRAHGGRWKIEVKDVEELFEFELFPLLLAMEQ